MTVKLIDIAAVIRSKNSGPYELTLDIVFRDRLWYDRICGAQAINRQQIARLYQIAEADVYEVIAFDPALAIKITMKRPVVSGSVGDSDVYGAQQHAPLLGIHFTEFDIGAG